MKRLCYVLVLVASCFGRSCATLRGKVQASKPNRSNQKVLGDGQKNLFAIKSSLLDKSDAQVNTKIYTLQAEQAKAAAAAAVATITNPAMAAVPSLVSFPTILNPKLIGNVTLDSFDNFVYINLASRRDRRTRIEQMLASFQVDPRKVHRIGASLTPGLWDKGCSLSHLSAIELAIQRNWDHVVILEDDFEFTVSPTELSKRLTDFFAAYPGNSWDVFMFAGYPVETQPSGCNGVLLAKQVMGKSAYVVNRPFFDTLRSVYLSSYKELSEPECFSFHPFISWQKRDKCRPLDVLWMDVMQAANWFVCMPALGHEHVAYVGVGI